MSAIDIKEIKIIKDIKKKKKDIEKIDPTTYDEKRIFSKIRTAIKKNK